MLTKTLALTAALVLGMASPMLAQEAETEAVASTMAAGAFNLELNTATELDGGACRLVYVAQNGTDTDIDKATYEVAVFNERNVVSNMLLFTFDNMASNKTRVIQFDIPEQSCAEISKVLVNDAQECATASGESDICMRNLTARALDTEIEFTN